MFSFWTYFKYFWFRFWWDLKTYELAYLDIVYIPILFAIYDPIQVKVMHYTPGMSIQWKWPINNDEIWYEKVVQKIVPPESIHSDRCTSVTGLFKFDENVNFSRYILETLQCYIFSNFNMF